MSQSGTIGSGTSQEDGAQVEGARDHLRSAQDLAAVSVKPRKLPQPAAPVSGEELMPDVEQLSFPFDAAFPCGFRCRMTFSIG